VERPIKPLLRLGAVALVASGLLTGCGGTRQDHAEPSGTFKVRVVKASFPAHQHIADSTLMRVVVRNTDTRTLPDVAVSILSDTPGDTAGGFYAKNTEPGLADASRGVWLVDQGPRGGDTAYVSTWALGPLPAGRTRTFEWHVTPVVAGTHTVRYRVAPGLNGKARIDHGEPTTGTFKVQVSAKPAEATVNPATGAVEKTS
jgi:hypothetical protein